MSFQFWLISLRKKTIPSSEQLQLLFQSVTRTKATPSRIALTTSDEMMFVTMQDILYCEAGSNYTCVMLSGSKRIVV